MKKNVCLLLSGAIIGTAVSEIPYAGKSSVLTAEATDFFSKDIDALQYTYEIYPLLEPFNEYFFVKTDNPHPESFRFSDKDSTYSETSVIYNEDSVYADVEYENEEIFRVNGGYIFRSTTTDGGEVELQIHEDITREEFNTEIYGTPDPEVTGYSPYHGMPVDTYNEYINGSNSYYIRGYFRWADTGLKFTLPELCDDCDYLIQNFSEGNDFFSDMNAIQKGFSSICLYSGSYVRGEVYRSGERDWRLAGAPYVDQKFYIYSPYNRKDNKSLFSSSIYPYRYDSLGFPGMMKQVALRLDESAVCEWSDSSHAHVNVTLNGETHTYGGQGNGEGQGISEDKIIRRYSFGENDESVTLQEAKSVLEDYMAIEMEDDIPREGELTWETIYNSVGDGEWVDMGGSFTYLYQMDDEASFNCDEWGVGNSIYWSGSLGYCSDMWVDGRYISKFKRYVKGAALEEHPESSVLIREMTVPEIVDYTREWDSQAQKFNYKSVQIAETVQKNVVFRYDAESQLWKADTHRWGTNNYFSMYQELLDQGVLDEKYYDMVTLTRDEFEAAVNIGKTDKEPESGVLFDGYSPQGTHYMNGDCNSDDACSIADLVVLQKWLLCDSGDSMINMRNSDLCKDDQLDSFDLCMLRMLIIDSYAEFD